MTAIKFFERKRQKNRPFFEKNLIILESWAKVRHFKVYTGAGRPPVKNVGHKSGIFSTEIGLPKNKMPSPASGIGPKFASLR